MAFNWTQLQARAAILASFGGWTDTATAPAWDVLTNQAWQEFSWVSELLIDSETITAVNAQVSYVTVKTYKSVLDVTYGGKGLLRSNEPFERFNPSWLQTPAGTPLRWVLSQLGDTISLVPPPNGTLSITVRGIVQGLPMAVGADLPGQVSGVGTPIPAYFHEAIAKRAAVLWGELYAQGDEIVRLNAYMDEYLAYANDARAGTTTAYAKRRAPEQGGELFKPGGQG